LFWIGGKGYVGYGAVAGGARVPTSRIEAPWPGGMARWTYVVPIRIWVEISVPIEYKFVRSRQLNTEFTTARFQRGFSRVEDEPAKEVARKILWQSLSNEN